MTYKDLLVRLLDFTQDQLNQDVCVYDEGVDEYYQLKVELVYAGQEQDVLDLDHPIIRF
jgi:hypothetical protein